MFDIIGDVHGHGNDLLGLLTEMGYTLKDGFYSHPNRKVIFAGDLVDGGCNHQLVMSIVIPMVQGGAALAVMGNHEFNALAYWTQDPEVEGEYLRPHTQKNTAQHQAFIDAFVNKAERDTILEFLWSLPVFLEVDGIRVVHACWNDHAISVIKPLLTDRNTLTPELLVKASRKGSKEYDAIETLLKGVEAKLPEGLSFKDKRGVERYHVRTKWWLTDAKTYGDAAIGQYDDEITSAPLTAELSGYKENLPPVFLGHYWMKGEPEPLAANIACVDYSVAMGGKLVAYRYDGESVLQSTKFAYLDKP